MEIIKKLEVELPTGFKRKLILKKPHQEFIRFIKQSGGPGMFAEFSFAINPRKDSKIKITLLGEETLYLEMMEKGIVAGLQKVIENRKVRGIEFGGFDLVVRNIRSHPVDSKPICFQIPFVQKMFHLVESDFFEKKIIAYEGRNDMYEIVANPQRDQVNFSGVQTIYFDLPNRFSSTIVLKDNWKIKSKVEGLQYTEGVTELLVSVENSFSKRNLNKIILQINGEIQYFIISSICKQLEELKESIYSRGYNLGGLKIMVEPIKDWNQEYSPQLFFNSTIWALKNIFENQTQIKFEDVRSLK